MTYEISMSEADKGPRGLRSLKSLLERDIDSDTLHQRTRELGPGPEMSSLLSQASYHRLIETASKIGVPKTDPDLRKSAGIYTRADESNDETARASYFSDAVFHLSKAISNYVRSSF